MQKKLDNGTWTSITYDAAGRTTAVANLKSDDSVISSFDYACDGAGNRLSVVEAGGDRVTWTYDRTYQLLTEDRSGVSGYTHTFTYDPVGNRLTKDDGTTVTTSVYDAANRLQTAEDGSGVTTYTFDANGNERSIETPSGDLTTYTWDFENQMVRAEDPLGDITTYVYSAQEQRVSKETETETTKFLWDGQNIVQEYDELDVTQADYTHDPQPAPQPFGNLVSQHRDVESSFYHFDALGSTRELTDSAEVETDDYTYEAFGKVASSSGTTENPFQWVGAKGVYTQEDERRWMRAREMDAASGRFLSEDPARDDSNLYRYTGNNAVTTSDPSGLNGPLTEFDDLRRVLLPESAQRSDLLDQESLFDQLPPDQANELRKQFGLPPLEDEKTKYARMQPVVEGLVTQLTLHQLVAIARPTQDAVDTLSSPAAQTDPFAQLLLMVIQVLEGQPKTGRMQPSGDEIDNAVDKLLCDGVGQSFFGGDVGAKESLIREILFADIDNKVDADWYGDPRMNALAPLTPKQVRIEAELHDIAAVLGDKTATDEAVAGARFRFAVIQGDQATQDWMMYQATEGVIVSMLGARVAAMEPKPLGMRLDPAAARDFVRARQRGIGAPPPEGFEWAPHVGRTPVGPDALPSPEFRRERTGGMRSGRSSESRRSSPRAGSLFPEQRPLEPTSSQNPLEPRVIPSLNNWAYFELLRSQGRMYPSSGPTPLLSSYAELRFDQPHARLALVEGRGAWKRSGRLLGLERNDSLVYVVRSSDGEFLKVGETGSWESRFGEYLRRARAENKEVEVLIWKIRDHRKHVRINEFETPLRRYLKAQGHPLDWDKSIPGSTP